MAICATSNQAMPVQRGRNLTRLLSFTSALRVNSETAKAFWLQPLTCRDSEQIKRPKAVCLVLCGKRIRVWCF